MFGNVLNLGGGAAHNGFNIIRTVWGVLLKAVLVLREARQRKSVP
ncbi:hypothetical protein [Deinococcus hopiensis]|nr:hypothetical protein [Deinococcus hopiensis]